MNKLEVLQQIREHASSMDEHASYEEMVNGLAVMLSESKGRFSKEVFNELIELGAALYKAGHSQYKARVEVTALMEKSVEERVREP